MKTFICLDCGTFFVGAQEEAVKKGWIECVGKESCCAFCPRCQIAAHEKIANQKEDWDETIENRFSTTRFYSKYIHAIP